MRIPLIMSMALATMFASVTAQAFCGFYVARADTSLFNRASQVVLTRDGNRTIVTMANDFQGDVAEFAMVIPVPTFIERGQINVAEPTLIEHLDAYTSPRLVEYHDPDPCQRHDLYEKRQLSDFPATSAQRPERAGRSRGVTVEAEYTVGEYDIQILAAEESGGLVEWLRHNGYRIPPGAEPVVRSYLRQDMRFFVARVNLEEQSRLGFTRLRPLQVAYESRRFMLPIRLGTVNANGPQELFVYTLTRSGRVETTNYRTARLPSNEELPEYVGEEFADFYRAMFRHQTDKEDGRAVFLEYAWDMAWCDPCAADPLSAAELRKLGVFWLDDSAVPGKRPRGGPQDVFVTRLHLRYDAERFPEDLMLHETGDRNNFQGRYVIRHPWRADTACDASAYRASVRERQQAQAQTLASLTGWNLEDIRQRIDFLDSPDAGAPGEAQPWWRRLWN